MTEVAYLAVLHCSGAGIHRVVSQHCGNIVDVRVGWTARASGVAMEAVSGVVTASETAELEAVASDATTPTAPGGARAADECLSDRLAPMEFLLARAGLCSSF